MARIYAWYRHFEVLQGQVREAVADCEEVSQPLAAVPAKPQHRWRYEQLRPGTGSKWLAKRRLRGIRRLLRAV